LISKEKQLSLLKREYPQGEGVPKTPKQSFKLLRPNGHLLLSKRRSLCKLLKNKKTTLPLG
jgi:hypothetical protein